MSTQTQQLDRLTRAPIDHNNKLAVWLARSIFTENKNLNGVCLLDDVYLSRYVDYLPFSAQTVFWKTWKRLKQNAENAHNERRKASARGKRVAIAKQMFSRPRLRGLIRKKLLNFFQELDWMIYHDQDNQTPHELGKRFKRMERDLLATITPKAKYEGKTLAKTLPLYACSGELEAASLKYQTLNLRKDRPFFHSGRDGGGQPEIRFRIHPTTTRLACSQVRSIGSQSRNGGHIHLNCQGDEQTGERVYSAFRSHLVWFRYLANHARRSGRWSSVDNTPPYFADARRTKAAAISANTWTHTGTVEVRLWGTTAKPEEWHYRASLMQSLARMSETVTTIRTPLQREYSKDTFLEFARWAAVNDPQTLRETLHRLRKKGRTTTDRIGAEVCRQLVAAFDASDIRLTGYRRRTPAATITPTL